MLEDFNPDCLVTIQGCGYEVGSAEVTFKGAGYGLLISLILKSTLHSSRKRWVRYLIDDFNEAKNGGNDGKKEEGDAEGDEMSAEAM